jgi:hypothetical protein
MTTHTNSGASPPAQTGGAAPLYSSGSSMSTFRPSTTPEEMRTILDPLIERMKQYDRLRLELQTEGGKLELAQNISDLLNKPFELEGLHRASRAQLTDPGSVSHAILDTLGSTVTLDVRRQNHSMPTYYLCRIRRDYWLGASVIVEDLYRSPGHPVLDTRFATIMQSGHEQSVIRASPYRSGVATLLEGSTPYTSDWAIDDFLFGVGQECLSSMWHEDQLLGIRVADHFGLTKLKESIELLYLILGGDLCGLRAAVHPKWNDFFSEVYPHPTLCAFLKHLPHQSGRDLGELPTLAIRQFAGLAKTFRDFLETEVRWGTEETVVSIHKLILGNFYDLEPVAHKLLDCGGISEATRVLEERAGLLCEQLTGLPKAA